MKDLDANMKIAACVTSPLPGLLNWYTTEKKHQTGPPCGILDDHSGSRLRTCDGRMGLPCQRLNSAFLLLHVFPLVVSSLWSPSIQCLSVLWCGKLGNMSVVMGEDTSFWKWLECSCLTKLRAMKTMGTCRGTRMGAWHRRVLNIALRIKKGLR